MRRLTAATPFSPGRDPEVKASCNPHGELRLEASSVSAFQGVDLPRVWNDSDREPDDDPYDQLAAMFQRVRAHSTRGAR